MGWIPVYMCQLSKSKYLDNSFCRIPTKYTEITLKPQRFTWKWLEVK